MTAAGVAAASSDRRSGPREASLFLAVAIVLVALNLRVSITSLAALLDTMGDLGISPSTQGVLTSLPMLCYGILGVAAMRVSRRLGPDHGLTASLILLTLGVALRAIGETPALIMGTVVAGAGVAVANVLLPSIIKEYFPTNVGAVTGAYTAAMSLGSASGAALTVPVANALGSWRWGLGIWAIVTLVTILIWLPFARSKRSQENIRQNRQVWRNGTAWAVTLFFATQTILAFVVMSWLPSMFISAGLSDERAGVMLAICILTGVPFMLVSPNVAARFPRHQGLVAIAFTVPTLLGMTGIWIAPASGAALWAVLIGVGNSTFALSLAFVSFRTRSSADTIALSALAQCVGYLIAAAGTFAVGLLRDATGSWDYVNVLLVGVAATQLALGYLAGRPVQIGTLDSDPANWVQSGIDR